MKLIEVENHTDLSRLAVTNHLFWHMLFCFFEYHQNKLFCVSHYFFSHTLNLAGLDKIRKYTSQYWTYVLNVYTLYYTLHHIFFCDLYSAVMLEFVWITCDCHITHESDRISQGINTTVLMPVSLGMLEQMSCAQNNPARSWMLSHWPVGCDVVLHVFDYLRWKCIRFSFWTLNCKECALHLNIEKTQTDVFTCNTLTWQ